MSMGARLVLFPKFDPDLVLEVVQASTRRRSCPPCRRSTSGSPRRPTPRASRCAASASPSRARCRCSARRRRAVGGRDGRLPRRGLRPVGVLARCSWRTRWPRTAARRHRGPAAARHRVPRGRPREARRATSRRARRASCSCAARRCSRATGRSPRRPRPSSSTIRRRPLVPHRRHRHDRRRRASCAIVDRIKELIITGGFNVAPSEVEEALRHHPDVVGRRRRRPARRALGRARSSRRSCCATGRRARRRRHPREFAAGAPHRLQGAEARRPCRRAAALAHRQGAAPPGAHRRCSNAEG